MNFSKYEEKKKRGEAVKIKENQVKQTKKNGVKFLRNV